MTRRVVIYTSLDQNLSQPILEAYEAKTGIKVDVLYDTEATKTVGLANRLLAEKESPKADVFWNSEIIRTIVLKRNDVLTPYASPQRTAIPDNFKDPESYWTGFAARARVIAVNTEQLQPHEWPQTYAELADEKWRGQVTMAYPLFGTTSTHIAALFSTWGPENTKEWLHGLVDMGVHVVDGNSTARDRVAAGSVLAALTDTDDVAVARAQNKPIAMIFPDLHGDGTLLIPNTVALIAGAPHPEEGKALIDYLLSPEVEIALSKADGAQIPVRPGLPWPEQLPPHDSLRPMAVDYESVADALELAAVFCRDLFVR